MSFVLPFLSTALPSRILLARTLPSLIRQRCLLEFYSRAVFAYISALPYRILLARILRIYISALPSKILLARILRVRATSLLRWTVHRTGRDGRRTARSSHGTRRCPPGSVAARSGRRTARTPHGSGRTPHSSVAARNGTVAARLGRRTARSPHGSARTPPRPAPGNKH